MTDFERLHARALGRLVAGDTEGGAADLEAWLTCAPDDAAAWLDLGAAHLALARWADAEAALARAPLSALVDRSNAMNR